MLKKLIWLFVVLPAGILLVAFAFANRHTVRLNLDPLSSDDPFLALEGPFFLFILSALVTGVLTGGFVAWLGQRKWRKQARANAREVAAQQARAGELEAQLRGQSTPRLDTAAPGERHA